MLPDINAKATTIVSSWTAPRVFPCPKCGTYRVGLWGHSEIKCGACAKIYKVAERYGGIPLPAASHDLNWAVRTTDEDGNRYAVWEDKTYGWNWLLEIDLLGSGYQLQYGGTFWRLASAKRAARYFRHNWQWLFLDGGFRQHYGLPDAAVDLVGLVETPETMASLAKGEWRPAWNP